MDTCKRFIRNSPYQYGTRKDNTDYVKITGVTFKKNADKSEVTAKSIIDGNIVRTNYKKFDSAFNIEPRNRQQSDSAFIGYDTSATIYSYY